MPIHKDFDGDYKESAEKAGKDIANSITKCPFCLSERGFSIVYGDCNSWINQDYIDGIKAGDYEECRTWSSVYHYLLRCRSEPCEKISLFKFTWSSKVNRSYENAVEDSIDEWQEFGYSTNVSMLEGANLQILYPHDADEALIGSKEIKSVSPNFVKIYSQASIAEKTGLSEICGMGYRKALENLVTDFAIYKNSLASLNPLVVEDMPWELNKKIHEYHSDMPDFIACAERAAWIGNDETHMVKKQINFSITDMKELINVLVQGVKLKVMAEDYKTKMQPAHKGAVTKQ